MDTQESPDADRWKASIPDEQTNPIGSIEFARRAVERLGPFKHKLHDEAQRHPRERGVRIALSEELALERVWMLARAYNRQDRLEQGAPRSKNVVERLIKLQKLAGELALHLTSLDDITRHRLQTCGTGVNGFGERFKDPIIDQADMAGLPTPGDRNDEETPSRWLQRLAALSLYSAATLAMFLDAKGIDNIDVPDKGGSTNLYKDLYGSARWAFVQEGWHTYELFKPGNATGTEGGPFHLFLLDVFEYATGLDPEEHSKLTYWLKRVSKVNRRYKQVMNRQEALQRERDEVQRSGLNISGADRSKRTAELSEKLIVLERERDELWPSLFPFSYRLQKARQ